MTSALHEALARHPRHVLLVALVAGLLAGPRWPVAVLGATLLIAVLVRPGATALGAVAVLLAGAAVADARLAALDRSTLGPWLDREATLRATLLEAPRVGSFGVRVAAARVRSRPGAGERVLLRVPARVPWPPAAATGAEVLVRGRLVALHERDEHERRRGAHATVRVESVSTTGRRRAGVAGALDAVRRRTEHALVTGLPPPQGALARGMVLGQDGALTDDVRADFRATGLAHLVAASGANVLLLATLVLAVGTAAGLGLTARLSLALVLVAAYIPLAGAGPSIQRAGVMGAAGLVAALAGRPSSRWYALLLAAAVTLGWSPRSAEDPGWQLSFAAVLAMLALVPGLRVRLRRAGAPQALAEVLAVTAAATLGTAPLISLHFERVSFVSLPANLLAAPAVAPVMWLGTVAGAIGQVAPGLAEPIAAIAALPLGYLTWLAARAAALPWAETSVPAPGPLGVAALYAAAALALLARRKAARGRGAGASRSGREDASGGEGAPRGEGASDGRSPGAGEDTSDRAPRGLGILLARRPVRRAAIGLAAVGAVAAVLVASRPPGPPEDLTVSFLDIGQGDATLVQHGSAAVLVDTGPPGSPILKRLRDAGVDELDVLVLTHASADHDGGAAAVLARHRVGLVLDGGEATGRTPGLDAAAALAARARVRRVPTDAGQVVRAGPLELRVLWPRRDPPAPPGSDPNLRATVLHVRDGAFDLLLTADAESDVTSAIALPLVDAMKVAHHGSEDTGLSALLARVRPRAAVIPVGPNTYGHPHPSTLRALRTVPHVRRTDRHGTVRLRVRAGRMTIEGSG